MTDNKLVLIMAGGTGGHVFPGLATADCLLAAGASVAWLGTRKGIESTLVPSADIPISYLHVEGLRGKGIGSLLRAPFQLIRAIIEALLVVKKISPHCVLGMGGFASGPGGIAAWLLGKPLLIHEQNAVAGTTNRILSLFAKRVMQAFPSAFGNRSKVINTGNPIRQNISELPEPSQADFAADRPLRILVLGGSLGAKAINDVMPELLATFSEQDKPEVWHQVGRAHAETVQQVYQSKQLKVRVDAFIDNMQETYQWADLVVCRAGALTVSELTAAGRGAILIPYPFAIDDHQTKNAQWFVADGAGVLIAQDQLTAETLRQQIEPLIVQRSKLLTMAVKARHLATPDAAQLVAKACLEVALD